ncbi:hypothetical protein R1flu_024606 [Riccia fluitans]|uniref:Uncharacterized protein n=1 Tax=Riccia fluitans TaxID=41844 RepID=A0ABD1XVT9_9MARC
MWTATRCETQALPVTTEKRIPGRADATIMGTSPLASITVMRTPAPFTATLGRSDVIAKGVSRHITIDRHADANSIFSEGYVPDSESESDIFLLSLDKKAQRSSFALRVEVLTPEPVTPVMMQPSQEHDTPSALIQSQPKHLRS